MIPWRVAHSELTKCHKIEKASFRRVKLIIFDTVDFPAKEELPSLMVNFLEKHLARVISV